MSPLFYADSLGYFKDEGLNVQLKWMPNAGDNVTAVASGALPIGHVPFTTAFSTLKVVVEGTVCDGDQVVVRWCATGVHSGDGLGMKATHKPVTLRGMTWIRMKDGKFHEGWQSSNITEVMRSLPEPP